MKKFMTQLITFLSFLLIASQASAKLAGYNVILVNGFQAGDLNSTPSNTEVEQIRQDYWKDFWLARSEGALHWGSQHRVSGGIAAHIFEQAKALSAAGTCNNGCVFVTHSTGDLVLRYFLENQDDWFADVGMQPLNVISVLDFAGAGGGTELANIAIGVANGDGSNAETIAIAAWLGFSDINDFGVMNDLQTSVARNTATAPNAAPRLRFAGTGWAYGGVTNPFISGWGDSVVPLHSACGASQEGAYDSCASYVNSEGELGSFNAPSNLRSNHYVVLMGGNTNHGETINVSETNGILTYVSNDFRAGLDVDFGTYTETSGWWWTTTYQYINDSKKKAMSVAVYDNLN